MKLLLLTPYFPPEVGSASHLYYELSRALSSRGHQVTVVTGLARYNVVNGHQRPRYRPVTLERCQGFKVCRVLNLDIPWNRPLLRGVDQIIAATCAGLTGLGLPSFDLALVYSPPLPLALAALALCRLRGRPLVANVQDLFPQSAIDLGLMHHPLIIRIFKAMESLLYRRADLIMAHSDGNRKYILAHGGHRRPIKTLPNWVDTDAIRPASRFNGFRKQWGLNDRFIVSFAGVMGYSQDLATILAAAARLQANKDILFLLVGDGVEKPHLVAHARRHHLDNVLFLPMQSRETYPEILAASDLCLTTLKAAVHTPVVPYKILNIMAAGRPLLACLPAAGDAAGLVRRSRCGFHLEPGDPAALAQAILQLYEDPDLAARLGNNGRAYAEAHFSLEASLTRLERLLGETLAHYHP